MTERSFLWKVWLRNGIDMEVMSGIYGFLYAALLSQGQDIGWCLGTRLQSRYEDVWEIQSRLSVFYFPSRLTARTPRRHIQNRVEAFKTAVD